MLKKARSRSTTFCQIEKFQLVSYLLLFLIKIKIENNKIIKLSLFLSLRGFLQNGISREVVGMLGAKYAEFMDTIA